jgi:hypothetical protein
MQEERQQIEQIVTINSENRSNNRQKKVPVVFMDVYSFIHTTEQTLHE